MSRLLFFVATFCYLAAVVTPYEYASFLGPAFEAPHNPSGYKPLKRTFETLRKKLYDALAHGDSSHGNFPPNETSVAIRIESIHEAEPLFDFGFTSPFLNHHAGGVKQVESDTVFRIGSVSKLFTVYTVLRCSGFETLDQAVIDLVPELNCTESKLAEKGRLESPIWKDITIGALASQMSGIARDYNLADLSLQGENWVAAGLPPLNASEIPKCAGSESQRPCTRKEFLQGFKSLPPVFPTYYSPAYSNSAFRILSYAVETLTNMTYSDVLEKFVLHPLGLQRTSLTKPRNSEGVIPAGDSAWGWDLGGEGPDGGMYSSAQDLAKFARAILSNSQLSETDTRRWMKPMAHTARLELSVGAPWEIHRFQLLEPGRRVIDLYAKSGSVGEYASHLVLIPDYDVSVVVLMAGPDGAVVNYVTNIVFDAIIPQLEAAARLATAKTLAGTYRAASKSLNSSITLTADGNAPGLLVSRFVSNGSDILAVAAAFAASTGGGTLRSIRLFPTGLSSRAAGGTQVAYRAVFETVGGGQDEGIFRANDGAWESVDEIVYGRGAVDEFVFTLEDGETSPAIGVENAALRAYLVREMTS